MGLAFRILPDMGLCYVRYSGLIRPDETIQLLDEYATHPDYRPGQKQLVDLRDVIKVNFDYPALLEIQAKKTEAIHVPGAPTLVAYLAGSPETIRVARTIQRSWDGISDVIARIFADESDALAFLGLPQTDLQSILVRVA